MTDSKNYSRVPVRFLRNNDDLLKAQTGVESEGPGWAGQRHGDHWASDREPYHPVMPGVQPMYRTPADRVSGNELFRRYPNGQLDVERAKNTVVDALHRVADSGGHDQLNTLEKVALSVLFPQSFSYVSPGMVSSVAAVQLKLTPVEIIQIKTSVARHLSEELNWNAGLGGSSVPGRSVTRE